MKSKNIYWKILFNTNNQVTLKKIRNKTDAIIGESILLKEEIYWKDKSLYEVELEQFISSENPLEILNLILNRCSMLSNNWHFIIPRQFDFNSSNLSGICESGIIIPGVFWINIEIR